MRRLRKVLWRVRTRRKPSRKARINERRKAQAGRLAGLEKVEAERERIIAAARQEAAALVEKSNAETERQVAAAKAALEGETKAIADRIVNAVLSRSA